MTLALRKAAEVDLKLAGLRQEFMHWRVEAAVLGPLERHHTQVEAIINQLTIAAESLDHRFREIEADAVITKAGAIEAVILDLHRIWDVFRSKLVFRYFDRYVHYLRAADELAYSCYTPAEQRGANREPALLYFGGEASPIIRVRGAAHSSAGRAARGSEPLTEAIDRLPVPLIGIPWVQIMHLPEAPVIAHEVGHDVEFDLGLQPTVQRIVDRALIDVGVDESRRRGWRAWRAELFADVFGTLALGPAFTAALIDVLATEPHAVATEFQGDPVWRRYPPRTLRVLISTAALTAMDRGFEPAAEHLRRAWFSAFPTHAMREFVPDVRHVVSAVVAGPYAAIGDDPLTRLIALPIDMWERVERDADSVLRGRVPAGLGARGLVAAARIAFDRDQPLYRTGAVSERILKRIAEGQQVATRTGHDTPVDVSVRSARDHAAGVWLAEHLEAAHGLRPPGVFPPTEPWDS